MRRAAAIGFALGIVVGSLLSIRGSGVSTACSTPPTFPDNPIWCFALTPEPVTRTATATTWLDTFDTGPGDEFGQLNAAYSAFDAGNAGDAIHTQTFQHAKHWMVDIQDTNGALLGGTMVSPQQRFPFVNGVLSVEIDAAAAQDGAGGANVFYEVDISPSLPTAYPVDQLYGYGQFGGVGAIGCRLERAVEYGIHPICSMYDDSYRTAGGMDVGPNCNQPPTYVQCPTGRSGRTWETQGYGTAATAPSVEGGYSGYPIPGTALRASDVARICDVTVNPPAAMPDTYCRDRWRFEFDYNRQTITIFVNGYRWFTIAGLYPVNPDTGADNRIPASWQSGVYVYLTSWVNGVGTGVNRWHWARLAVNTPNSGAAPSYCYGQPFNTCAMTMR